MNMTNITRLLAALADDEIQMTTRFLPTGLVEVAIVNRADDRALLTPAPVAFTRDLGVLRVAEGTLAEAIEKLNALCAY